MANRKKTKAERAESSRLHAVDVVRSAVYRASLECGQLRNGRPRQQQTHGASRTKAARERSACRGRQGSDE